MSTEILTEDNPFLVPLEEPSHQIQIKNTIRDMVAFAENLIVNSEAAYKKITSLYAQARQWKKAVEEKRKEMTEPLRKQTSAINDKAKELTDPLDRVIATANAKVSGYHQLLEEKKRQEEEKLRAAAALFDAGCEIYIPPIEMPVRGEGAICITKTEKKFHLIDIAKVPTKYLMVDEAAIKKDLLLGISEIPGLEVYETTTTTLRTK